MSNRAFLSLVVAVVCLLPAASLPPTDAIVKTEVKIGPLISPNA